MSTTIPAPCEASAIESAAHPAAGEAGAGVLATTILGSSLAFIDGSVVTVALPAMQSSMSLPETALQWIVNAYLLPLGALLLLGGASGDRFGQARVFVLGLLLFGAASVACAMASTPGLLIAGRAAQGVGAAFLVPSSLAILGSAFPALRRTMAIATWAAASAITGALAPLLGGWLVDTFSWRAIFLINPPIVVVTLVLAKRYLHRDSEAPERRANGLDWAGAASITMSLGLLSWGLIELGSGRRTGWAWASVAGAVVLGAGFLIVESKRGDAAMMPLRLFASPVFSAVNLLTLLLYAALAALLLLLPFLMIRVAGWDAVEAGAALLPLPVTIGLLSRAAGKWSERYGARVFLTGGPLIVAAGMLLFLRLDGGRSHFDFAADILPGLLVVALGMALTVSPLTSTLISAVDRTHTGIASGINNAIARIAALVASASVGPVLLRAGDPQAFVAAFKIAAGTSAFLIAVAAAISAWMMSAHATGRRS